MAQKIKIVSAQPAMGADGFPEKDNYGNVKTWIVAQLGTSNTAKGFIKGKNHYDMGDELIAEICDTKNPEIKWFKKQKPEHPAMGNGMGGPVRTSGPVQAMSGREPLMTDVEARAKLTAEKHDGMLAVLCGICRLSVEEAEAKIREKVLDDFVNIGSTIGTSVFMGLMRGEFTKTHKSAVDEMPESQVDDSVPF